MDNDVHFGDGVLDDAKAVVNSEVKELVKTFIHTISDYLKGKVKNLPETIERILNSPETEREIAVLWSEHLFEEGLVPKGYNGLPDNLLISNFHQKGYSDGLYAGYVLAMMALTDNDAPKDIILSARDCIRPNLAGHYDDKDEFIHRYREEKYSWIDKAREIN